MRDDAFDLAAWGAFLDRAARRTHPDAEAICPFGFELTGDRSFLRPDLARFYVLLRLAPQTAGREHGTALAFLRHLRRDLERRAPRFSGTVGVWRCDRRNVELNGAAGGPPLRMINVLGRVTPASAIDDYASYLVAAARGILDGTVGEAAAFERSTRARRRLFQLVEMIGRACELALGAPPVGTFPRTEIYRGELAAFAAGRENQAIEAVERELLRDWALPALGGLVARMEAPDSPADRPLRIEAVDQYSGAPLSCSLSAAKYARLRAVVERTYREFHTPAAAPRRRPQRARADLTTTFRETLAARHARARAAMDAHLRGLAGAPPGPSRVFHPRGGLVLDPAQVAACRRRLPVLWAALAAAGLGRSTHSFAGEYLAADPGLYVAPPPWTARRRRIDARIRALLAALPDRLPRADLDFAAWLGLMVALDALRTDLCSVLWNELAIADAGGSSAARLARCDDALGACARATLALLPAVDGARTADPRRRREIVLGERLRAPDALESPPPEGLAADAVRAVRASDDTFLVWASLFTLAAEDAAPAAPCWAIGNGFGGLDLGGFVAAALAGRGVEAAAGTCRAGGHRAPRAEPGRVRWPAGGAPRTILFCDDSVSSGGTFAAFRETCRRAFPAAAVEPFVLTYDLGAHRGDDAAERSRFALARFATAPAPWSPSPHPKVAAPRHLPDLLAALRGSSDERLRWIAETQAATVAALDEAER